LIGVVAVLPSPAVEALSRAERKEVLKEIERLEVELLRADDDIRGATVAIREMDAQLADIEKQRSDSNGRMDEREERMAIRLKAMYRLRHRGFLPLLFAAKTPHEFLRIARYLWWIVKADNEAVRDWRKDVDNQKELKERLDTERDAVLARTGEIAIQAKASGQLRDERQALIGTIGPRDRRHIKTMLVEKRAKKLDVSLDLRNEAPPAEIPVEATAPTVSFERNKRRLPMPVVGPVSPSGRGIDIEAPEGRSIRAVADGQVLKILHISGFGLVCIIDHGGGWSSVYGHASGYTVKVGQPVQSGEEIGLVGQTGSLEGPRLHFQIRHEQEAKKPLDWLLIPPGIRVRGR